jgi:flagellar hook-length control protein FliK
MNASSAFSLLPPAAAGSGATESAPTAETALSVPPASPCGGTSSGTAPSFQDFLQNSATTPVQPISVAPLNTDDLAATIEVLSFASPDAAATLEPAATWDLPLKSADRTTAGKTATDANPDDAETLALNALLAPPPSWQPLPLQPVDAGAGAPGAAVQALSDLILDRGNAPASDTTAGKKLAVATTDAASTDVTVELPPALGADQISALPKMTATADLSEAPQRDPRSSSGDNVVQLRPEASLGDLQSLKQLAANQSSAPQTVRTVTQSVHHPQWAQAVATEVRWCADNGVQSATLRLTPEHLGPVEVQVNVNDGEVNVNFSAEHAETRAALEQSIPRLREMMSSAGLSLGEAQVQQQTRHQPRAHFGSGVNGNNSDVTERLPTRAMMRLGLVDEYA